MLRALYHYVRFRYYMAAVRHVHPLNPDLFMLSQRAIESERAFSHFVGVGSWQR